VDLPSGEKLSLFVNEAEMTGSVHGGKLSCTDCHANITSYPHKKLQVNSKREYSVSAYEACKRCHFANYTKTLDSMHYKIMESGNQKAPLCTDCHGYHNVTVPDEPRSKISKACAQCHQDVYNSYAKSVHGAALLKDENKDVPLCTDCHGSHTVKDAGSAAFRLNSPEMCAKCHADEALMKKYGLSANVFKTYAQDFHGVTVQLSKKQNPNAPTDVAVCSDCHGVHDIQSTKTGDPKLLKQRVLASCQKCHPDASSNFPDAWLSHYDISPDKAPLPWLVRAFYTVLIPFMIGGLALHIVVDLWRIARNR
jgi:predicted CXXCH cytochrome family protein